MIKAIKNKINIKNTIIDYKENKEVNLIMLGFIIILIVLHLILYSL